MYNSGDLLEISNIYVNALGHHLFRSSCLPALDSISSVPNTYLLRNHCIEYFWLDLYKSLHRTLVQVQLFISYV